MTRPHDVIENDPSEAYIARAIMRMEPWQIELLGRVCEMLEGGVPFRIAQRWLSVQLDKNRTEPPA